MLAFLSSKDSVNIDCLFTAGVKKGEKNQISDYVFNFFEKYTSTSLSLFQEVWYQRTCLGCLPIIPDVPADMHLVSLL